MNLLTTFISAVLLSTSALSQPAATEAVVPVTLCQLEEAMKDMQRSEELSEEVEGLLEPPPLVNKPKPPIQ